MLQQPWFWLVLSVVLGVLFLLIIIRKKRGYLFSPPIDKMTERQLSNHLAKARKKDGSYDLLWKNWNQGHLSIILLGLWADGERPESFLEEYLAQNTEHTSKCEKCLNNVAFFKAEYEKRQKK